MIKREIPWIPIGITAGVIVVAVVAIMALQPAPKATPAGSADLRC